MNSTVLEQLHKDIHDYVNQLVLTKVLPAISAKWSIPLEQLTQFVNSSEQKVSSGKPVKKSGGGGLTDKVAEAKSQSKYYNVATGKLINDTAANRKKYTFYKDLAIAGVEGDPKTVNVIEQLTSNEEPAPAAAPEVNIAAEIAKELALEATKTVAARKKRVSIKEPMVEEEQKPVVVETKKKTVVEEEHPKPVVVETKKKTVVEEEEDVSEVVKLSEMIEEKSVAEDEKIQSRFNSKVRANVFQPLGFAHRKVGGMTQIIGKLDPTGTKLVELTPEDMKECKRRNWLVAFT